MPERNERANPDILLMPPIPSATTQRRQRGHQHGDSGGLQELSAAHLFHWPPSCISPISGASIFVLNYH